MSSDSLVKRDAPRKSMDGFNGRRFEDCNAKTGEGTMKLIRGTTKHNRLEANSSPIAEPSVKAVSFKRNK